MAYESGGVFFGAHKAYEPGGNFYSEPRKRTSVGVFSALTKRIRQGVFWAPRKGMRWVCYFFGA